MSTSDVQLVILMVSLLLLPLQFETLHLFYCHSRSCNDYALLFLVVLIVSLQNVLKIKHFTATSSLKFCIFVAGAFLLSTLVRGNLNSTSANMAFAIIILSLLLVESSIVRYRGIAVFSIFGILAIHAQWGITNFLMQRDLGLQFIGESNLVIGAPATATFTLYNQKTLRAYGPFPHPNSLAGSLLLGSVLIGIIFTRVHSRTYIMSILLLYTLAIILSGSRLAWIGLLLVAVISTSRYIRACHKFRNNLAFAILLPMTVLSPLMIYRVTDANSKAASERMIGFEYWYSIVNSQSIIFSGVGFDNYIPYLRGMVPITQQETDPWNIAPVHSLPLLVIAELGLVPFVIMAIAYFYAVQRNSRIWIAPVLPALMLDHYFYTQAFPLLLLLSLIPISHGIYRAPNLSFHKK